MLNGRRRLAVEFLAGAGALPSTASLTAEVLKTFQVEEKLTRRCLLPFASGSSVDLGNEWLCPDFKLPSAGLSCGSVLERDFGNVKKLLNFCTDDESGELGDPIAPNPALGDLTEFLSWSAM